MNKVILQALRSAVASVFILAVGASAATAATTTGGGTDVGQGLGKLLGNLGQDLLLPIAGLFGLAAFFRRDVGHAVTILVIAVIVGIFVYNPGGSATKLINTVASAITGS